MSTCAPRWSHASAIKSGEHLSVLVPCHNEADTVVELLTRVRASLPLAEIIVIDDGSTDDSLEKIKQSAKKLDLVVLSNQVRTGKGAAVRKGLSAATRGWVVIQDADLEYDPADLARLEQAAVANPGCAVYGSRYLAQGKAAGGSLAAFLGVKFLAVFARLLYGRYLTDPHTCYKMVPTAVMRRLTLESTGFELCAEITGKLLNEQISIIEIPISYQPRSIAEGKKIRTSDFFKAVGMYWRCRFGSTAGTAAKNPSPRVCSLVASPEYWGGGFLLYSVTRFVVGALLVIAGAMKLAPWREVPLTAWLVLPAAAVFAIGVAEFVLGCLVLSFAKTRSASLRDTSRLTCSYIQRTCLAVFAGYIGVLLVQLSSGETACQCLGSRSLPLLWMLGLDSLLLVAIWIFRKQWYTPLPQMNSGFWSEVISSARYALPVLALIGALTFGSLDAAIGYVTGSRVLATSTTQHVGRLSGGEIGTATFELTNYSGESIQILGAKPTCKCLAFDDLPLTLAPGASGQIRLRLKAADGENAQLQREGATLILDDPTRLLTLSVTASVIPPP